MASHGVTRASQGPPRSAQDREKEVSRIEDYQRLVADVNGRIERREFTRESLASTGKLLVRNPEYYTIWNHRRRILRYLIEEIGESHTAQLIDPPNPNDSVLELVHQDLDFLLPLLRRFPKCYWIWNHRLWLLEESSKTLPKGLSRSLWEQELSLVGKMLTLDSRNFHGWGYRRTVIAALESPLLQLSESEVQLTQQEFDYTTKMINTNLSNFSAWHNRSKLIPKLLTERNADAEARRNMLDQELEFIERALWAGDNDSSLWFYHQYLLSAFDPKIASQSIAPDLTQEQRKKYLLAEIDKVLEMLEGAEDCKWIYQALISMSDVYVRLAGERPQKASSPIEWLQALQSSDGLRTGRWRDALTNVHDPGKPR